MTPTPTSTAKTHVFGAASETSRKLSDLDTFSGLDSCKR